MRPFEGVRDKVDWNILFGESGGDWAGFLRQAGVDPTRVLVLMNTATEVGPGPFTETVDSEESISAGVGGLVGEVPDLLGVVGWDFAHAEPAGSPWLWTQYAARALAEGDYVPGEQARARRHRRIRDGVAAFVSVMLVVAAGGAVWVRFRYAPTRRLPVYETELDESTPASTAPWVWCRRPACLPNNRRRAPPSPGAGSSGGGGGGRMRIWPRWCGCCRIVAARSPTLTGRGSPVRWGWSTNRRWWALMRFARAMLERRPGDAGRVHQRWPDPGSGGAGGSGRGASGGECGGVGGVGGGSAGNAVPGALDVG